MTRIVSTMVPVVLVVVVAAAVGVTGLRVVRVAGDSMRPALRVGDVAVFRKGAVVRPGDVVVLRHGAGARVLHRLVSIDEDGGLRTKGDANAVIDREPLQASDIEGCVLWVLPTGWPARVDLPGRGATLLSQLDRWL
jgi:signal peptidase I